MSASRNANASFKQVAKSKKIDISQSHPRIASLIEKQQHSPGIASRDKVISELAQLHRVPSTKGPDSGKGTKLVGQDPVNGKRIPVKRIQNTGKLGSGAHRPSTNGGLSSTSSLVTYVQDGRESMCVSRHTSLASYRKARDAPLANKSDWGGSNMQEHESTEHGRRRLLVSGREFLGDVTTGETALTLGQRIGMYVLNPEALGGRLQLYANQFEENSVKRMTVHYCPTVPATQAGAIYIYFRNDVGCRTTVIGRAELLHAATVVPFAETQVWTEQRLSIRPHDILLEYFDESVNDFRMNTQGFIQVGAASDLDASTTYGNLFLEYEFEFVGASLDYEISDVNTSLVTFLSSTYSSHANGAPIVFTETETGFPGGTILGYRGTNLLTYGDIFYGVVTSVSTAFGALQLFVAGDEANGSINIAVGQGLWFAVYAAPSGGADLVRRMVVFSNLAALTAERSGAVDATAEVHDGQLYYTATQAAGGQADEIIFTVDGRIWDYATE